MRAKWCTKLLSISLLRIPQVNQFEHHSQLRQPAAKVAQAQAKWEAEQELDHVEGSKGDPGALAAQPGAQLKWGGEEEEGGREPG